MNKAFINPAGQRDNIGDSVLRRAFMNRLRTRAELHVLVGQDESYASGLGLQPTDVLYRSKAAWLKAAILNHDSRRTVFAINPGEINLTLGYCKELAWQLLLLAATKLRGGSGIATGVGIRHPVGPARFALPLLFRNCSVVAWRDYVSQDVLRLGEVAPDWAFWEGADDATIRASLLEPERRRYVAISMRGDRPFPSSKWFEAVSGFATRSNCSLIVVTQVKRDKEHSVQLAGKLGAEHLDWEQGDHAAQEKAVRRIYSKSLAVVSDRVHALIIGMTEGAMPIGFTTGNPEKVGRTFGVLSKRKLAFSESDFATREEALNAFESTIRARDELLTELDTARSRLIDLDRRIQQLL